MPPWLRQRFQARRDDHTVTEQIVALRHDLALMHADPQTQPVRPGRSACSWMAMAQRNACTALANATRNPSPSGLEQAAAMRGCEQARQFRCAACARAPTWQARQRRPWRNSRRHRLPGCRPDGASPRSCAMLPRHERNAARFGGQSMPGTYLDAMAWPESSLWVAACLGAEGPLRVESVRLSIIAKQTLRATGLHSPFTIPAVKLGDRVEMSGRNGSGGDQGSRARAGRGVSAHRLADGARTRPVRRRAERRRGRADPRRGRQRCDCRAARSDPAGAAAACPHRTDRAKPLGRSVRAGLPHRR